MCDPCKRTTTADSDQWFSHNVPILSDLWFYPKKKKKLEIRILGDLFLKNVVKMLTFMKVVLNRQIYAPVWAVS